MESNYTPAGRTSKSGTRGADDHTNLADWRAAYANKGKRAEKAIKLVRRGHRVFIGSLAAANLNTWSGRWSKWPFSWLVGVSTGSPSSWINQRNSALLIQRIYTSLEGGPGLELPPSEILEVLSSHGSQLE
jgi:hypothetical protein